MTDSVPPDATDAGDAVPVPTDDHVRVRSYPQRARYDAEFAYQILDEGRIGHLSTTMDGYPHIVPMMYLRRGDQLHIHGRRKTPLIAHLTAGARLAFAVTLVDGVVLARDVRFHSMNYRSLVIHGTATVVEDPEEIRASFTALAERAWPGRAGINPPTADQLAPVELLTVPIETFSAKTRTGPPTTPASSANPDVWAGHVDFRTGPGEFHADEITADGLTPPVWPF